jgi:hypothetical protein
MKSGSLAWLVVTVTVVAAVMLSSCLSGGDGGSEQRTASLIIDFKGNGGSTNPGNLTTWTKVENTWMPATLSNGGKTVWVFNNVTSGSTVLDLVEECSKIGGFEIVTKHYIGLGTLMESIGGVHNEKPGRGWQYYVNGQYATKACDLFAMDNNDVVTWMFADLTDLAR